MYNIKILTNSDNIVVTDATIKTFQIVCKNKEIS